MAGKEAGHEGKRKVVVVEFNPKRILEADGLFHSTCSLRPQMSCFSPIRVTFIKLNSGAFYI